ncbi:uncharacterized protein LOC144618023 [Crassostrea virginica]
MPQEHAAEYHKNSMKNVRAAINRHLKDIGREIDIVKDIEFKSSNTIHETHKKNHQGGVEETNEEAYDKRMYASGTPSCPVQSLKLFLSKTDPNALSLFNECNKGALHDENPMNHDIWYSNKPVKPQKLTSFMPDICKNARTRRFTAHSLRTTAITAITAMSDAGLTDRNIMFMFDHKCEESLKSYCRRPRNELKKGISTILGSVATGEKNKTTVNSIVPTRASHFYSVCECKVLSLHIDNS